jgi:hypothetical protein
LKGIKEDILLLEKALIRSGMFAKDEIKIVLDKQATKANMMGAFKKWLVDGTNRGDTALFYFSGHGTKVFEVPGEETQDGMDEALVCWDSKIFSPRVRRVIRGVEREAVDQKQTQNLLIDYELQALLKRLTGRTVVFLSDSCFSGTVYGRVDPFFVQNKTIDDQPIGYKSVFDDRTSTPVTKAVKLRSAAIVGDSVIPDVSLAALTASHDTQTAAVHNFNVQPTGHHSVFTWFLLHGLEGKARKNRQGAITLGALAEFISHGVKQSGFAQTPQAVFSPKILADKPLVHRRTEESQSSRPEPPAIRDVIERPVGLACLMEAGPGISSAEVGKLKIKVQRSLPAMKWTDRKDQVSCKVVLEKTSGNYGARLSDATGDYWETNKGSDLEAVASGLAGNLRAFYIQTALAGLNNPSGTRKVNINLTVKGPKPRSQGEAVQGDSVVFAAETQTGGYPYVFSVDTVGVIHPLFPVPNKEVRRLEPGARGFLGSEGSFVVAEPFGKEMVFTLMLDKPPSSLAPLWAQDHIGDSKQESFEPQQRFLDTLWNELAASGKPRGDWTCRSWLIRSFKQ